MIGEEALTINSFASDWFVDQKQKRFGARHSPHDTDEPSMGEVFLDF